MLPSRATDAAHPRLSFLCSLPPFLVHIPPRAINRQRAFAGGTPIRWRCEAGGGRRVVFFTERRVLSYRTSVAAPTSDWLSLRYGRSAAVAARRAVPRRTASSRGYILRHVCARGRAPDAADRRRCAARGYLLENASRGPPAKWRTPQVGESARRDACREIRSHGIHRIHGNLRDDEEQRKTVVFNISSLLLRS